MEGRHARLREQPTRRQIPSPPGTVPTAVDGALSNSGVGFGPTAGSPEPRKALGGSAARPNLCFWRYRVGHDAASITRRGISFNRSRERVLSHQDINMLHHFRQLFSYIDEPLYSCGLLASGDDVVEVLVAEATGGARRRSLARPRFRALPASGTSSPHTIRGRTRG